VCDLALRFDRLGPQLYHTDPSGTFGRYDAGAVGSGSETAQSELQDKWHKQMTLNEAQTLTLRVLKQVMEEKLDQHNVQLAQVTKTKGFEILDDTRQRPSDNDVANA